MSAFFVWLEFSGRSIEPSVAQAMLDNIAAYGGDFKELMVSDNVAIGAHIRWSTPEDVGTKQPISNANETDCFLFDGRIDNRMHLLNELTLSRTISDGALLYAFLSRFGEARLAEVIGPFAFVWFDFSTGCLRCARDAMGGRYLVYRQHADRLLIASTELALLPHPDVGHRLNTTKVASWLVNHHENQHSACLEGLTSVNPGQSIQWAKPDKQPGAERTFYRPNPARRVRLDNDAEYAAEFRRLLDQAVQRRLRSVGKVGSMLSGGLDSVPITISAAKIGGVERLIAYSWVFEQSPESDERHYSVPICQNLGLKQTFIPCDDLWPQFNQDTHNNPLFPFALPYSEYQQQMFRQASNDGVTVMLSGLQGDLLYERSNEEVHDAFKQGGIQAAYRAFQHHRTQAKLRLWGGAKRYLISPFRFVQRGLEWRRLFRPAHRPSFTEKVLTEKMREQLPHQRHWLFDSSLKARRPVQYRITLDGFAGEDAMLGRVMENKYRVERRYPFRDRELCEFMLAIPTSQLVRLGAVRPIVKNAYRSEFSDELMARNDKTQFSSRLYEGIREDKKWQYLLNQSPSFWQKYVKQCDLYNETVGQSPYLVVLWQCAYYNFWHSMWYDSSSNIDGYHKVK